MRVTLFLIVLWLGLSLTAAPAQSLPPPDHQLTNAIRVAEAQLRGQRRDLTPAELKTLAEATGRSNWLGQIASEMLRTNEFTRAAVILQSSPGLVNQLQIYGMPVLYRAVQDNNTNLIDFLLQHRADPNGPVTYHQVPLGMALQYQRWNLAERLVRAGASLLQTNIYGQAPVQFLLQSWTYSYGYNGNDASNRLSFLRLVLEHNFDPFAPTSGNDGNRASFLEQTLQREGGYQTTGPWGRSSRLILPTSPASPSPIDFSSLMLTNRAQPGRRTPGGETAWHLAAYWSRTNALEFLLAAGFSPDLTNAAGLTALQTLAGADPNAQAASGASIAWLLAHDASVNGFTAAGLGLTNELAQWLAAGPERLEARDAFGRTPLHYTLSALPPGANPFFPSSARFPGVAMNAAPNANTNTPAQIATLNLLLARGADVNAATTRVVPRLNNSHEPLPAGTTPLHLLARRNHPALLRTLLAAKANVAAADENGDTPLHFAARTWQSNSVHLLVLAKAPLNVTNHSGRTPLRNAVEAGLTGSAAQLINAGASLTNGLDGTTLLHLAARNYNDDLPALLMQHGIAIEARDAGGRTPLQIAAEARQWAPLRYLRQRGANLNAADHEGNTALHQLATQQYEQVNHEVEQTWWVTWQRQQNQSPGWKGRAFRWIYSTKIISPPPGPVWTNSSVSEWLLKKGANVNITNRAGQTPLHVLLTQSWLQYGDASQFTNRIRPLLAAGARVNTRDTNGFTPLTAAMAANVNPQVIIFLLRETGGDVNATDAAGRTLLHAALAGNQIELDRLTALFAAGLNPNATNRDGLTPLHLVLGSELNHRDWQRGQLLQLFLTNGANPNLADRAGNTPLHYALRGYANNSSYQLREPLTLLITNGANPNLTNHAGQTPLHLIAQPTYPYAHPGEHLQPWIDPAQWNFTIADRDGNTPIHYWATNLQNCWTCLEFFKNAATNGAVANATNHAGDTPLHLALKAGNEHAALRLIQAGADPLRRDASGRTALRRVIETSTDYSLEQSLRPPGADQNFFQSLRFRDAKAVDLWLAADPSLCAATNRSGQTPLLIATELGNASLAKRLLELGAPLDPLSALRLGRLADFLALLPDVPSPVPDPWTFEAVRFNRLEALQSLVSRGADVNTPDADGHSLLFRARAQKREEITQWLLAQGGRETLFDAVVQGDEAALRAQLEASPGGIRIPSRSGLTPLYVAASANQPGAITLLLERGAEVNLSVNGGWTPLHAAAANDAVEIAQRLLAAGAAPNAMSGAGMAPLHLAAALGGTNVGALLIARGADVNQLPPEAGGYSRNTPLHWAAHKGQLEMFKLLLAHGADLKALNRQNQTPMELALATKRGQHWGAPTPPGIRIRSSQTMFRPETRDAMLKELEAAASKP